MTSEAARAWNGRGATIIRHFNRNAVKSTGEATALQGALHSARSGFVAVGVFSFFLNLLMLATPLYMLQVFNRVLSSGHTYTLLYLTIITLFALAILGILYGIRAWILGRLSSWLGSALSPRLIGASLHSSLMGSPLGSQPLNDLRQIQTFISGTGITAMFDAPWVPIFVAVIWVMHPWLGALALASAVALFTLALLNELGTRRPQRESQQHQSGAQQFAESSLRNAEVVQAMGMLPGLLGRWQRLNMQAVEPQNLAGGRSAFIMAASRFLRLGVQVGILGMGAMLVLNSQITPGQMIAGSILLGRALAPVEQSIGAWRSFTMARTSFDRLQELLRRVPEERETIELPAPEGHLRVDNLTFIPAGAKKPVLSNVQFSLQPGEMLGVIGPSAAGKSTLCRLLMGVWSPSAGAVRLDSAEVTSWNRQDFGRHVGYLPQDIELFSGTIRQNIARMDDARDAEVIEAAKLAGVHEMILHLPEGYDTEIQIGGGTLSAGQRQRVALARALFRKPVFIVLDEPNASLDRVGEAALVRALKTMREQGSTIVIVAHHANMLADVDKLLVLAGGRVTAFGPRSEVLAHLSVERTEPARVRSEEGTVREDRKSIDGGAP
jgi:PrtD family type I secretion system ABC transporter